MNRTKLVFFGGSKGGVGKSATSHLACLGAILCNQAAAYVLTDPDREIRDKGRPYDVLDGRQPKDLANILNASRSTSEGWLIIDGGGNRPAFDSAIAEEADLCIFPFRPSHEDMDTVSQDMDRITNALAWPAAWPTNIFAIPAAQGFINRLAKKYPSRVITKPIPFVNSASDLLAESLETPSPPVRRLARKVFSLMEDAYARRATKGKRALAG
jgi:cellulose biosynthesis protein BcsQ